MKTTKNSFMYDEFILQGMFYCPFGKANNSCFFHWLQKKPTTDKMAWYNSLSLRDKQDLMYCHFKCSGKQTSGLDKIKYFQNN